MVRKYPLPAPWYSTIDEVAHEFGVHRDRVMYHVNAGLIQPAALIPKASLPVSIPGPSRHVCVLLHDYRGMDWQSIGGDSVAPLAGEFRAFQIDGLGFSNLTIAGCDGVVVSQADLVVPIAELEALEALCAPAAKLNSTERRTFLCMLDLLAEAAYPDQAGQPYAMAEHMLRELQLRGVNISKETLASKLKEARDVLAAEVAKAA